MGLQLDMNRGAYKHSKKELEIEGGHRPHWGLPGIDLALAFVWGWQCIIF
jgi:hypothetical protein